MEVSLLDVEGLPKGCLVSVRSGTQRCQAPADPDKLRLFFPKGAQGPFKVDLLAPLGSAEITYQPGANAYPIQVPINGKIGSLTIGVREMEKPNKLDLNAISTMEYTKDEKGRPATPSTASRRHRLALQARTYLEEHQLLVFVQSLLQGLIRDRPVDPWGYINETSTTAKKLGVPQPYKPGLTPRDQDTPPTRKAIPAFLQMVSPKGITWSEYVAPSRPVVNEEGKLTGPWLELMRAAVAFEHSTPDLSSQAELAEAETAPSGIVNEFLESCGYGEFAEALAMVAGETHARYAAVGKAADGGSAAGEATPVVSLSRPESAYRTGAKSKEMQLSMDAVNQALASLEEVQLPFEQKPSVGTWLSVPPPRSREAVAAITPEARLPEPNSEDVLRETVLKVLDQASQDGTMDKLALQMNAMEKLRAEAQKQLLEAAADGSLLKAVPGAVASAEAEAAAAAKIKKLQSKARTALLEAGDSGKLAEVLAQQQQQMAKALPAPLSPELASLRGEMQRLLVQAAESGTFEKALQGLRSSTAQAAPLLPWYPLPDISASAAATIMATRAVEPKNAQESELEEVRNRAQDVLLQASKDGSLHKALVGSKAEPSSDEIRRNAANLLMKAGQDGSLLAALQASKTAAAPEVIPEAESEAGVMRRRAQEMLKQAMGSDPTFLTALQEAAEAAGYEFELRPKPKASARPTLADEPADVEALRAQARAKLVEASLDGRFIQALEEVSGEIALEDESADVEALRAQARAKLVEASLDGRFMQALEEVSGEIATQAASNDEEHLCKGNKVIEAAKENAREALTSVLLSSSYETLPSLPEDEIEVAKENARAALMNAFLGSEADPLQDGCPSDGVQSASLTHTDTEIEVSKANAREALTAALLSDEGQEDFASAASNSVASKDAKDNASAAIEAALSASPEETRSEAPGEQKQFEPTPAEKKPQEPKSEPSPEEQKQAEVQAEAPGDAEMKMIHMRSALPPPSETLQAHNAATSEEFAQQLRTRNERFKAENGALKRENKRLQALLDRKQYAEKARAGPDAS